jgi:hypothetical protein
MARQLTDKGGVVVDVDLFKLVVSNPRHKLPLSLDGALLQPLLLPLGFLPHWLLSDVATERGQQARCW